MFIKRKKNRSGTISVVVAEKNSGIYKELITIGIARGTEDLDSLMSKAREWIDRDQERRHPRLDLFGEERKGCEAELLNAEQMLSCITNISINGADLILDRVFDSVGFNRIEDPVFRQLVKARLAYPASEVYAAYHNLWYVERAFRISKSKIEIRPMFHFTHRRIKAHVCICFVALKVYKELERLLKLSNVNMNIDKVLALAQTIVPIQMTLPKNKQVINRTMLMKRHQRIAPLFSDEFEVRIDEVRRKSIFVVLIVLCEMFQYRLQYFVLC